MMMLLICDHTCVFSETVFRKDALKIAEGLHKRAQAMVARATKAGLQLTALQLHLNDTRIWVRGGRLGATVDLAAKTVCFHLRTADEANTQIIAVAVIQ